MEPIVMNRKLERRIRRRAYELATIERERAYQSLVARLTGLVEAAEVDAQAIEAWEP